MTNSMIDHDYIQGLGSVSVASEAEATSTWRLWLVNAFNDMGLLLQTAIKQKVMRNWGNRTRLVKQV